MNTITIPNVATGRHVQLLTVPAAKLRVDDIIAASTWYRVAVATVYNDEDCTSVSVVAEPLDGSRTATVQFLGGVLVPILRPEPAGQVHVTGEVVAALLGGASS